MKHNELIYIHPAPVRVWHWINAVGILLLVITGLQIRYAEVIHIFSLEEAINLHNYIGLVVIANYFLWFSFYFGTGKIRIYLFHPVKSLPDVIKQMIYYGHGIFKGDPHPHQITPENKFNAMQKQAYLGLMLFLLPMQMISGLFLWKLKFFDEYIKMIGGIKIIDTIHVLLFFFFAIFLLVHSYLASLGHTPTAHFKAMFTGYEEKH